MRNLLIVLLIGSVVFGSANATDYYVNFGTGNDSTTNADNPFGGTPFKNLQPAIDKAADGDTIIIAFGFIATVYVYVPTEFPDGADTNDPRNKAFHTDGKNIAFLGGSDNGQYFEALPSLLSGDIDGDDVVMGNTDNNVYHVFILDRVDNTTRLDRFQIQGGNANSSSSYVYTYTHPTLGVVNSTISNDVGGGLYNINSAPLLIANYFRDNYSDTDGAGLYNLDSSPKILNSVFYNNTAASNGAGMFNNNSSPEIINATFIQNNAMLDGGGIYNQTPSTPLIHNTVMYDNSAVIGANIAGDNIDPASSHNASDSGGGNTSLGQNYIDLSPFAASDIFVDITDPDIFFSHNSQFITRVGFEPAVSSPLINAGLTSVNTLLQPPFNYIIGNNNNSQIIDLSTRTRARGCTIDIGGYESALPVTIFVDSDAANNGSGDSWNDPVRDLQVALDCATTAISEQRIVGDTVKVAQGIYKPTQSPDDVSTDLRDRAFHLDKSIYLKGGYNPLTGLQDLSNPSILSGDFNGDDVVTGSGASLVISNNEENAYHVMITNDLVENINSFISGGNLSLMDNFNIQGGNADDNTNSISFSNEIFARQFGGGMTTFGSRTRISNVTFYANSAVAGGGYFDTINPTVFYAVKFIKNSASNNGGGMFTTSTNLVGTGDVLNNVVFAGNKAKSGGGLLCSQTSLKIFNALFIGNAATVSSGGGFEIINPTGETNIYNSTFVNNEAITQGGGFDFIDPNFVFTSLPIIKNTVFFNNTAASFTDLFSRDNSGQNISPDSTNNASDGIGGNIKNLGVFVDLSSVSLTLADLFVAGNDPDGADNIYATPDDGLVPNSTSLLLDIGTSSLATDGFVPDIETTQDLAGFPRFYPTIIDIGAYEYFVDDVFSDGFEF